MRVTLKDHAIIVWVVSWYNAGEEPVVTVFSNEENAMKYYNYELANGHVKVAIDECPIYNTLQKNEKVQKAEVNWE